MTCLSRIGFVLHQNVSHITFKQVNCKTGFTACSISLTCFAVITIVQIDSFESKNKCQSLFIYVLVLFECWFFVVVGVCVTENVAFFLVGLSWFFCSFALCRINRQFSLVHWQCFRIRFSSIAFRMAFFVYILEKHQSNPIIHTYNVDFKSFRSYRIVHNDSMCSTSIILLVIALILFTSCVRLEAIPNRILVCDVGHCALYIIQK